MTNVYELSGKCLKERAAAHEYLMQTLGFPAWYGKNLDALFDMLTAYAAQTMIWITDCESADPAIAKVFEDAMDANPKLTVIMQEGEDA